MKEETTIESVLKKKPNATDWKKRANTEQSLVTRASGVVQLASTWSIEVRGYN